MLEDQYYIGPKKKVDVPKEISHREGKQSAEILLELQGLSLQALLDMSSDKSFGKLTVYLIGIQLIQKLRLLHQSGFVHNNLKLDNILLGKQEFNEIQLNEFSLSCPFLDEEGKHIAKKNLEIFTGNFMFASNNSCEGYNKSRLDDI